MKLARLSLSSEVRRITQFRDSIHPFGLGRKAPALRRRRIGRTGKVRKFLSLGLCLIFRTRRGVPQRIGSNTTPLSHYDASDATVQ
jgi:hypothetical protein